MSRGSSRNYLNKTGWMSGILLLVFSLFSLLRIAALHQVGVTWLTYILLWIEFRERERILKCPQNDHSLWFISGQTQILKNFQFLVWYSSKTYDQILWNRHTATLIIINESRRKNIFTANLVLLYPCVLFSITTAAQTSGWAWMSWRTGRGRAWCAWARNGTGSPHHSTSRIHPLRLGFWNQSSEDSCQSKSC